MIGKNIENLAYAIASYEGWGPLGTSGAIPVGGSRSYRNHNPGNLRNSPFEVGTDGGFAVFYSDFVGMFALQYDLWIKASGKSKSGLTADSTLAEFVHVYAPPVENDSDAYLEFILLKTGFKRDMKLSELLVK